MKIISKGKYTSKIYMCDDCDCTFEIEHSDIIADITRNQYMIKIIDKLYVNCPECHREIILFDGEKDVFYNN